MLPATLKTTMQTLNLTADTDDRNNFGKAVLAIASAKAKEVQLCRSVCWVAPLLLLPNAPLLIKNLPLLFKKYLGRNVRENKNYELKKYNI